MVRTFVRLTPAALLAISLSGCLTPQSDALTGLISSSASSSTTSSGTTGNLYLKVSTAWETTPTIFETQITCRIPEGSATTSATCSGTVPEGQLHYSKIRFTVGTTNSSTCRILIFKPYYYVASNAAGFVPPWDTTTTVDCSVGAPDDAACYDGVAKEIVTSFPTYTGMYFLTAEGAEQSYDASSANEIHHPSNRYTCNNKVDPTAAVANYVANSMQNYVVECRDDHYNLQKQITLTFGDADLESGETPGAGTDDFNDWLAP